MAAADLSARLGALLAACARRDQRSLAELYELTSPQLFGVALRIVRREDWAEDVLQECYLRIWNHAPDYRAGLAAPMTWMTSIVRNRCLDWLRRPSFEVADGDGAVANPTPSADEGPYARPQRAGEAAGIADCLGTLDAKQRQAIVLAFYDGLSQAG